MTIALPPLPDRGLLADLCREVGTREAVQPDLVEKDFYMTRLLWALGQRFGQGLLLKGGTLLSKVDLGFLRMSEDADLVIPEPPSRNRGSNMRRTNEIRDGLREVEASVGVKRRFPGGEDHDGGSHRRWDLEYESAFGKQTIQLEVSMRPVYRAARRVQLAQLLRDPLAGSYEGAFCWALDADEARAEKVRAACTRDAIRDFYDLERLAEAGADLISPEFLQLVDAKLKEIGAPLLGEHVAPFGLTLKRRHELEKGAKAELPAVLRTAAPEFNLGRMLSRFEETWGRLAGRSKGKP